jgi:predicted transposase/invertase (TIGR01784 family)
MSQQALDPKLDIVFKLLFVRRPSLLVPLLHAVLQPDVPIVSAELLNPQLPKDGVDHKGAILDLRVRLGDGRQVDVEMQQAPHAAMPERALYYWARLYGSQLQPGETHDQLCPAVVVFFLAKKELETPRFHTIVRALDVHDHRPLSDALEIHFVELPKLPAVEPSDAALGRWGRFLVAYSKDERETLAREDPIMKEAKEALDELSADPKVRELARDRQMAWANHQIMMGAARKEGLAEGRSEGLAEGRTQGLVEAVLAVAEVLGLSLDDAQHQRLTSASAEELKALLTRLHTHQGWPH